MKQTAISIIIAVGFAAVWSSSAVAQEHWTALVCSSNAQKVDMQAGPSNTDNDVFATWHPSDGRKSFTLPTRSQSLNNIYFRAATPGHDQTDMEVLYDGRVVKKMSFNGGDEDHNLKANDHDDGC